MDQRCYNNAKRSLSKGRHSNQHHTAIVTTWVKPADIIAYDDKDVRLLGLIWFLLQINNIRDGS
jgi:hypothetical protein